VNAHDDKADVYSAGERAWMVRTQQIRAKLFGPLLRLLEACHVTPDHLTILSLLAGLAFCPLYGNYPVWALIALALHVAIDGLDGPLARHLGTASRKGSFTDSMADQTVIAASTITLMYLDVVSMLSGVLYIVTYTVVVLFAMARNAMKVPYRWLFRPRFYVYGWLIVERWYWPGSLDYLLWVCVAILSLKVLSGFWGIRRAM
jgi:phosphatidylglycerophosphate synthase